MAEACQITITGVVLAKPDGAWIQEVQALVERMALRQVHVKVEKATLCPTCTQAVIFYG